MVFLGDVGDDPGGSVAAAVIDEDELVFFFGRVHDRFKPLIGLADDRFFVIERDDDRIFDRTHIPHILPLPAEGYTVDVGEGKGGLLDIGVIYFGYDRLPP